MLRKCTTDKLLDELNAKRGVVYPEPGYSYFADIGGWGGPIRRSIYTILSPGGGVVYSAMNADTARKRIARIRAELVK